MNTVSTGVASGGSSASLSDLVNATGLYDSCAADAGAIIAVSDDGTLAATAINTTHVAVLRLYDDVVFKEVYGGARVSERVSGLGG